MVDLRPMRRKLWTIKDEMKSMKQKEQSHGYYRDSIIKTILNHYKIKLQDLSIEELEEELYAEEETTQFGEIPFTTGSLLNIGLEQARPSDYEIKLKGEDLIKQAREKGFTITPKTTSVDQRMVSKWKRHENYSKKISRDTLRQEPRHQSEK
jgi:hypothetical protein